MVARGKSVSSFPYRRFLTVARGGEQLKVHRESSYFISLDPDSPRCGHEIITSKKTEMNTGRRNFDFHRDERRLMKKKRIAPQLCLLSFTFICQDNCSVYHCLKDNTV